MSHLGGFLSLLDVKSGAHVTGIEVHETNIEGIGRIFWFLKKKKIPKLCFIT